MPVQSEGRSEDRIRAAFDASVLAWQEYVGSPGGQLRHSVIRHHLGVHLPGRSTILDVGGGTGEMAADLARDGHSVILVDFSPAMLAEARRRCQGLDVRVVDSDARALAGLFEAGSCSAVLCHSLLEFISDPAELLAQLTRVLRPGGVLSVVFGNRYHAPWQQAILRRDPRGARRGLDEEIASIDRFGLERHLFYPDAIRDMIVATGLTIAGEYGIRVFTDLMLDPPDLNADWLALELEASPRVPYRYSARFIQVVAEKR